MFIDVRAIGFGLTDALRHHVLARMRRVLEPFSRRVVNVTARLEDVNADRGGIDKRCSVVVALRRRSVLVAEAIHVDLYAAVDEVAARIRRSVNRAAKRRLHRERNDRQRPGAWLAL